LVILFNKSSKPEACWSGKGQDKHKLTMGRGLDLNPGFYRCKTTQRLYHRAIRLHLPGKFPIDKKAIVPAIMVRKARATFMVVVLVR